MKAAGLSTTIHSIVVLATLLNSACQGQVELEPVAVASIHDEPRNGDGDKFNVAPFEGLLRQGKTREDRAIVEYDLSSFVGRRLSKAQLRFQIAANNSGGSQDRVFDVTLYAGNGQRDLADYSVAGTAVTNVSYHVPDHHRDFDLDVQELVQEMLDNDVRFVGVRVDPRGDDNFPSIFHKTSLLLVVEKESAPEADDHIAIVVESPTPRESCVECPTRCLLECVSRHNVGRCSVGRVLLPQSCCRVSRCECYCIGHTTKRTRRRAFTVNRCR